MRTKTCVARRQGACPRHPRVGLPRQSACLEVNRKKRGGATSATRSCLVDFARGTLQCFVPEVGAFDGLAQGRPQVLVIHNLCIDDIHHWPAINLILLDSFWCDAAAASSSERIPWATSEGQGRPTCCTPRKGGQAAANRFVYPNATTKLWP